MLVHLSGRGKDQTKDGYSYRNLNFVYVELSLDGSESSQLSELENKREEGNV